MTFSVDLFYSFRSPYSYLALRRTVQMVTDYDVAVNLRPVYPLALRVPAFFKKTNPKFLSYVAIDAPRVAQYENIPYRFARPDPIVQDLTTLEVAEHQPYIHRVTRLAALAQTEGHSLQFAHAIAPVLWDGSVDGWHEGDHLARAAAAAGFDLPVMDKAIEADPGQRKGPRQLRPLGRANVRVRKGAVLRPGPHRPVDLAHGIQRSDPQERALTPHGCSRTKMPSTENMRQRHGR